MSSRTDQYEETYRNQEEPYGERPDDRADDRRFSYVPAWNWGGAWGLWPWTTREPEEAETGYDTREGADVDEGGVARFRDEGLITLLIVAGAILFVFPEPATSALGVVLVALGVLAWLVDRAT